MDIFISPLIPQVQKAVRQEAPPLLPSSRSFSTIPSPPPARHPITAQILTPSTSDSNPLPPRPNVLPRRTSCVQTTDRHTPLCLHGSFFFWSWFTICLVLFVLFVLLPFESTEKRKSHFVKKMADGLLWQHELYICSWITTGLLPLQMNKT